MRFSFIQAFNFMSKLSFDRILQSQGFGIRKYCRELIEDGEVSIAGEVQ